MLEFHYDRVVDYHPYRQDHPADRGGMLALRVSGQYIDLGRDLFARITHDVIWLVP